TRSTVPTCHPSPWERVTIRRMRRVSFAFSDFLRAPGRGLARRLCDEDVVRPLPSGAGPAIRKLAAIIRLRSQTAALRAGGERGSCLLLKERRNSLRR